MNWQPIETVPKDGTRVILWCGSVKNTFVGQWSKGQWVGCRYATPTMWTPIIPPKDQPS